MDSLFRFVLAALLVAHGTLKPASRDTARQKLILLMPSIFQVKLPWFISDRIPMFRPSSPGRRPRSIHPTPPPLTPRRPKGPPPQARSPSPSHPVHPTPPTTGARAPALSSPPPSSRRCLFLQPSSPLGLRPSKLSLPWTGDIIRTPATASTSRGPQATSPPGPSCRALLPPELLSLACSLPGRSCPARLQRERR